MANYVCSFLSQLSLNETPWAFTPMIIPNGPSEFQADIRVATLGTWRGVSAGLLSIEMIAADAVKANFPALDIIERPIASIVVEPQKAKHTEDQQAIKQDRDYEIWRRNHGQ